MGRPKGNGIVELVDEGQGKELGFFCMDLVKFLSDEIDERGDTSWEFWHGRFEEARLGKCAFRDKCERYARTMSRSWRQGVLMFDD